MITMLIWNWIVTYSDVLGALSGALLVVVGFLAAVIAIIHLQRYRTELNYNTLLNVTKEIAEEGASSDRSIVKEYGRKRAPEDDIKTLINKVRNGVNDNDAEIGRAVERTIARMDRVGFFLIDHRRKPITEPQEWLWVMTEELYDIVGKWVEYRQKLESGDYYQMGYGMYFTKLQRGQKGE